MDFRGFSAGMKLAERPLHATAALPAGTTRKAKPLENSTTIALSRLVAQQRALDVTATNIANASTPGFHAERMVFSDWLVKQTAAAEPPGGRMLAYTQDRTTYRDTQPGPVTRTGNALDLAIGDMDGYFTVQTPRGPRLTRAGHFELTATGQITDSQGEALLDTSGKPLQVGAADAVLSVTADGAISSENGQIGRIGIVAPTDAQRMRPEGGELFTADVPTQPVKAPKLLQGAVEDSNVQPTVELTRMITEMREFQFVTQMVQTEGDRQQSAIDKITQKRS